MTISHKMITKEKMMPDKRLLDDKSYLDNILLEGVERANIIASKKIKRIKEIVGF